MCWYFFSGLEELCGGLLKQTEGLKVLLLRNNQITEGGMKHLAKVLVRNTSTRNTFILSASLSVKACEFSVFLPQDHVKKTI